MGKRPKEETEEDAAAAELAAKKAAKKAKKAAAAAAAEEEEPEDPVAAKKAAKKAKKAAAAAAAEEEEAEEDPAAAALAAKKAAKKAKKAAAAAAAAEEEEEDPEAAKKAAKKAKKAAAAAVAEEEPKKEETVSCKPVDDEESFKDNTYKCCDCGQDWIDTADDQQFRWDKGFAETPKRCKDCRWAKKVRMEGGDPEAKKGKSKGKGKSGDNALTVFVRGLPFSTTEDVLQKDFAECGEVVSCRMPLNEEGNCKGIAFIAYADKESMDKAIAFNETDYGGRTIYCVPAADKPEGKGKGKDGKDGKDKGKGKGKKGKKGKAPSEAFAKSSGAIVESTGKKQTFDDSDDE